MTNNMYRCDLNIDLEYYTDEALQKIVCCDRLILIMDDNDPDIETYCATIVQKGPIRMRDVFSRLLNDNPQMGRELYFEGLKPLYDCVDGMYFVRLGS